MSCKQWCVLCGLFIVFIAQGQTLKGRVVDAQTNLPIETATVYFDNTTLGTTTNTKGEFSIDYNDAVQSVLVISFLGFEKQMIADYRTLSFLNIELKEQTDSLDEVIINTNDGLTRKQKLRQFRKEFLGTSTWAKSCKILNENDLILRYHKPTKTLTATSKNPVIVQNSKLQYEIAYDIIDFEIIYNYVDERNNVFNNKSVIYLGTSYYKPLLDRDKNRTQKNRLKAYNGSVQHFMRALYREQLEAYDYQIFFKGFMVNPWDYFKTSKHENPNIKQVVLEEQVTILYNKKAQSSLLATDTVFVVDQYGNYAPINKVLFVGDMGSQRIGDSLPFDYEPNSLD